MTNFFNATLEYQCPYCKKNRVLFIPKIMHSVDNAGYQEYYDIHRCINDEIKAGVIYVDEHLKVRSVAVIEQVNSSNEMRIKDVRNIPLPPKPLIYKDYTIPRKDFKGKKIQRITIHDGLRYVNFILTSGGANPIQTINGKSQYDFVTVEINCSCSNVTNSNRNWATVLANIIEKGIIIDPDFISFAGAFLDENIEWISDSLILELQLLVGAPYTIVESQRQDSSTVINGDVEETKIGQCILRLMSRLNKMPLIYLFVKTSVELGESLLFQDFVAELTKLVRKGKVTVKILEFVTAV